MADAFPTIPAYLGETLVTIYNNMVTTTNLLSYRTFYTLNTLLFK